MKKILPLIFIFLFSMTTWSQNDSDRVIGTVYDENKNALPNVSIARVGTKKTYKTDEKGNFSLRAKAKDTLIFTHEGYMQSITPVAGSEEIVIVLEENLLASKNKIEGALGLKKNKDEVTTAYGIVEGDNLNVANSNNNIQGLQGKVSGLNVNNDQVYLRGIRSIQANNSALVVIDGVVSTYDYLQTIDYNLIESVTVHKGANGAALYGSQAANGVIIVKTKKSLASNAGGSGLAERSNVEQYKYNKRLKVKVKNSKPDYIVSLENLESNDLAMAKYRTDKDAYADSPNYYIDVYEFFVNKNDEENSKEVLNDIINSESISGEQLRAIAYQLVALGKIEEANVVNNKTLKKMPNDVKSYRDLALGYSQVGKNQIAFNTLSTFLDTDLGETNGSSFKTITLHEVNHMIQNNPSLKTNDLASHNIIDTEFDLRIVVDWNRDAINLNVKIVDPFTEYVSAENPISKIGGEFSGILGLNEYVIRHAKKGTYYIVVNNSEDKPDAITQVKVTTFKNYGRENEQKEVTTIKLETQKKDQVIMQVKI